MRLYAAGGWSVRDEGINEKASRRSEVKEKQPPRGFLQDEDGIAGHMKASHTKLIDLGRKVEVCHHYSMSCHTSDETVY
jgi:hypothetical protein